MHRRSSSKDFHTENLTTKTLQTTESDANDQKGAFTSSLTQGIKLSNRSLSKDVS